MKKLSYPAGTNSAAKRGDEIGKHKGFRKAGKLDTAGQFKRATRT